MKDKPQQIIEESQKLCRDSWEIRNRARRAVEETKAISDQVWENICASRKALKKIKREMEGNLTFR